MALIWALHIPDQVLQPSWWILGWIIALIGVVWAGMGVEDEEIPRIGLFSAVFFLGTLFHLPMLNVHLLLPGIMGLFLGRRAILAIMVAMVLQAGMGHGGFTTVGINSVIMAFPALLAWVVFTPLLQKQSKETRWLPLFGFLLGFLPVLLVVILHSLTLYKGGVVDLTPQILVTLPFHLPVAIAEGLFLASALPFLAAAQMPPFRNTTQEPLVSNLSQGWLPPLIGLVGISGLAQAGYPPHPSRVESLHNLRIDWKVTGSDQIEVEAYFERGSPFQTGELIVKNSQGKEILRETRHDSGKFVVKIPEGNPGDLDLYIHAEDHLAHSKIPGEKRQTRETSQRPSSPEEATPAPTSAQQESKGLQFRDLLLGLSLILSITAFWMASRSLKKKTENQQ